MAKRKKYSIVEQLETLANQWATAEDIRIIGCVGKNTASKIKTEIKEEIEKEGKRLPYNLVPMKKVIEYFNIDINYLKKLAKLERGE